jgi:hypothetical protein
MKIIDDPQELQRIMVVRNRIAAENIVNFVDGEDDIVAHAFSAETSGQLIGVRNDYDIHEDHAVIAEPAPKDFDLLGREFIGQGFLLFSEDERLAVLFTVADYKLIAGPLSFLHRVFPDLSMQNREFIELKNEELSRPHFVGYEQALDTTTRFMDWLD